MPFRDMCKSYDFGDMLVSSAALYSDVPGPRDTVLNDETHFARIIVRIRKCSSGPAADRGLGKESQG